MISLEESKEMYNRLNNADKQLVQKVLIEVRNKYVMSGLSVDVPYFFYSIHKPMFMPGEEKEFLEITDPKEFTNQVFYYVSRFILNKRQQGAK